MSRNESVVCIAFNSCHLYWWSGALWSISWCGESNNQSTHHLSRGDVLLSYWAVWMRNSWLPWWASQSWDWWVRVVQLPLVTGLIRPRSSHQEQWLQPMVHSPSNDLPPRTAGPLHQSCFQTVLRDHVGQQPVPVQEKKFVQGSKKSGSLGLADFPVRQADFRQLPDGQAWLGMFDCWLNFGLAQDSFGQRKTEVQVAWRSS